ncbi:MAG TPA: LacI family DNA-binding transcriptional regulator [Chthonomonadales bacterium]|nr:LacI family DNA-binding transcriptional regulator [Chthonomonadales bacterium]
MSTITEVARRSGVAPSTVSYVLNNGPRTVRSETRERVLQAARELNYRPSAIARGLRRNRMDTLGVVFTDQNAEPVGDPYFAGVLGGFMSVAAANRQNTTLFTGDIWSRAGHGLPVYTDGRCDGLMLVSPPRSSPLVSGLLETGFPFVVVGDVYADTRIATVDVENYHSAKSAVEYLISLGHRRIAILSGPDENLSTGRRLDAYRDALIQHGLPVDERLILPGGFSTQSGYWRAKRLLQGEPRPTAVFAIFDSVAFGAIRAIEEAGYRVPEDISVIGFDDVAAAEFCRPALTTIRQPHREIGACAAELLLGEIDGRAAPQRQVLFSAELAVRASVMPARNA